MHFDEGKCAECGKKIPPNFHNGQEPHFCSQKCVDKTGGDWIDELEEAEPAAPGEEGFYVQDGQMWAYEDRALYLRHHAEREGERIAFARKSAEWHQEDFRRQWRRFKKELDDQQPKPEPEPTMPDDIPYRIRFEHTHVLAGSGAGKTTLLTHQVMADAFDARQPALIIIDGKGTWAPTLQRFACFAPDRAQSQRLIIINPQDRQPPALNMFSAQDSLIDGVSENLAYIFGSREFELSAKQRTAFTYAAQLIFSMPTPTIETLLALMQDPVEKTGGVPATSSFRSAIDQQPHINRRFFHELFYHPTEFLETKRQIQNRIYDLLSCRAFAAMFTQEENRLNMLDIMQSGKILIVDASPGAVGEKAASTFGRYIISLALSAARSRIDIPRAQWRPTFLYIDEAQLFVDEERTQPLLQQAREFNLGVILSHQKLADLSPTLRATFAGNTSSKYCANPSAADARDIAKDMRTEAEFILSQRHRDGHANFAAFIRGLTEQAVSYSFKLGTMDDTPKMTDVQYAEIMRRNRALMSSPQRAPRATPAPRLAAPTPPIAAIENPPVLADTPDDEW